MTASGSLVCAGALAGGLAGVRGVASVACVTHGRNSHDANSASGASSAVKYEWLDRAGDCIKVLASRVKPCGEHYTAGGKAMLRHRFCGNNGCENDRSRKGLRQRTRRTIMADTPTNSDLPRSTLIGIFDDRLAGENAVRDLEAAGFNEDQIGYAIRGSDATLGG